MKSKLGVVLAVAASLLVVAGPLLAHHSASMYDNEHTTTVTGTVTEFYFANPHSQIYFEVKDDKGNVGKWTAVSGPPSRLHRTGWDRNTVKPGDQIIVSGRRAKDGSKVMTLQKVILNGQEVRGAGGNID